MKILVALLLFGMFPGGFSAVRAAEGRMVENRILAIVGDTVVTREQVRIQVRRTTGLDESSLFRLYPSDPPEVVRTKSIRVIEEAYESLVVRALVLQEYKSLEKKGAKVPESFIDERVRQRIAGDRVQFARDLEREGRSFEQFRSELHDDIVFEAMKSQFVPDPIISPNKIEAFYQKHPERYRIEERVKVRTIYLTKSDGDGGPSVRGRMDNFSSLLKSGTDFKELEKSYSDVRIRDEPIEPQWREISSLDETIRGEIAKLKPGECSGVIEMPDRFVILRLEERDPGHALPLDEVRDSIEEDLKGQERNRGLDDWIHRLEAKILVRKF
jgi:peptidyl-prolyl cis-trans isomerase SurA